MKIDSWYQSKWHSQLDKSLQVSGKGDRTRETYDSTVRKLVVEFEHNK